MNHEAQRRPTQTFGHGTVSRDAAWSLAYTGVVRIATVGLSVAVARLVGPAGAGAFGVALQVTALGSTLAAFNLPVSLTKQLAETADPLRRAALLRTCLVLILSFGVVAAAALMLFAGRLGAVVYRDATLLPVLMWCAPLAIVTACQLWVEGALQGLRRFERLARWGTIVSALDLGLGVAGAAMGGVVGVLIARVVVRAGGVLAAIGLWLRGAFASAAPASTATGSEPTSEDSPRAEPAPATGSLVRSLMGYAGPALLTAAIILIGQTLLRMLLVRRSGLEAAGHFQAADSIAQGLLLIPAAAAAAFMPAVSRDRNTGYANLPRALKRALEQISGFNLGLCLVMMGCVPWVMPMLFGRDFGPARPVLVTLAAAYGLTGPGAIFGAVMLGRGEVWTGFCVNAAWVVVVLVSFWFGTGAMGALGAAFAIVVGYFFLLLVCAGVLAPAWKVPISSLFPSLGTTMVCIGLAGALALSPQVPGAVTAAICLLLGAGTFMRWGMPSLAEGGLSWPRN